jgi:ketopantoate reductase
MSKKIAVLGAGAVGSSVGGHLARHGEDVTLIDPWFEHIDAIRRNGLLLDGVEDSVVLSTCSSIRTSASSRGVVRENPDGIVCAQHQNSVDPRDETFQARSLCFFQETVRHLPSVSPWP